MSKVESLRTKAKAQLVAKYGRLMALYLTGKKGNFAGIPKEAKALSDSILSASDEGSLTALYNVTRQLKTNSKVQMKDVPALITGRAPPKPVRPDYTPVVQSIQSLSFRQHVVSQHGVDLYLKVENNKGVVSFKTISSKAEKNDVLEVKYGTLVKTTELIEEKDVRSKVFLKKGDVPKWKQFFEDNKAKLLEAEKTRLNKLKGTLSAQEKKKCEDKLKEIDSILKDLKADAKRKEKEELKRREDEAEKARNESFQKALKGKKQLKECEMYLNGKTQKLGQLPDPDAVKTALKKTIKEQFGGLFSSTSFFVTKDFSALDPINDETTLNDVFRGNLGTILDTVYVLESQWYRNGIPNGDKLATFQLYYEDEIEKKKANVAAAKTNALQKQQQEALKKKQEADAEEARRQRKQQEELARQTAEAARQTAADKKRKAEAAAMGRLKVKTAAVRAAARAAAQETLDAVRAAQLDAVRASKAARTKDCFSMLSVPNKGEPMARDQLKVKTAALFGTSTEQQNIFKILFLYALKHQYMEVKGEPIGLVCYRGDKLYYESPKTAGNEIELKTEDLKDVQLNMKKFREVSDNFLNDDELPVLDDKRASNFAGKKFPDKFEYVRMSSISRPYSKFGPFSGSIKPIRSIDTKEYTTLREANEGFKWLWKTAKQRYSGIDKLPMNVYVTKTTWTRPVGNQYFPVTLIARKYNDKGADAVTKYRTYYKNDQGKNIPFDYDEDIYWSIYVKKTVLKSAASRLRQGGKKTPKVPVPSAPLPSAPSPSDIQNECFIMGQDTFGLTETLKYRTGFLSVERRNILKTLFLYALEHRYMNVYDQTVDKICWRNGKLLYSGPQTSGLKELLEQDLKKVKVNMQVFQKVSDDFLNKNELPVFSDKRASDVAAKAFSDKTRLVGLSGVGIAPRDLVKDYVTLEDANKDMKWLWNRAKEKYFDQKPKQFTIFLFTKDRGLLGVGKGGIFPIVQLGLKQKDEANNVTNESLIFKSKDKDGTLYQQAYEDADISLVSNTPAAGPMVSTIWVPKSSLQQTSRLRRGGGQGGTRREMPTKEEIDSLDLSSPPAPRFVMDFEEGVTPALFSARIPELAEL